MNEPDENHVQEIQKRIGAALLWLGAIVAVLIFIDRSGIGLLSMPAFWYRSRSMHLLICVGLLVAGIFLLRRRSSQASDPDGLAVPSTDGWPVFESVRFYSRADCPLCDDAMDLLEDYGCWMPEIEFIDIAKDRLLEERHGDSVPVIEFDGRVHFRGRIDRVLLQRLIDSRQNKRVDTAGEHTS